MAKILGWAHKVEQMNELGKKVPVQEFHYTEEEKLIRIQSIIAVNPPDALKLIQSVLNT